MLAPFSHLQNDQPPSKDEACKIKTQIAGCLKELSIIDVEIEQIDGILNSFKQKQAHIQNSIDNCIAILTPVHYLPMDVLGAIFYHCLATHWHPIMSSSEAPILLTHICHNWRLIALSIPQLWSRFYIPLFHQFPQH